MCLIWIIIVWFIDVFPAAVKIITTVIASLVLIRNIGITATKFFTLFKENDLED